MPTPHPIERILVATDFSTASRRAFNTALALASSVHAKLTIVHVLVPVLPSIGKQYILDVATADRLERRAREWSVRRLQKLAADAARLGVDTAIGVRQGEPAAQILRAAASMRADVIVVGTHARNALSRLLIGSVAERVVRAARRPVLTVRGA